MVFATPEEIIEEARLGRAFILCDDEDRENEGDLIIPSVFATPEVINFMITHARGLVCLAMDRSIAERLSLSMQDKRGASRYGTAFTTSIEAATGVTTGISAFDRACTIAIATAQDSSPDSIVTPGHIFPLIAMDGGVLDRQGHTEASVDIARLAGVIPAAVICEIIAEDGHMARIPDLECFAKKHQIKMGTVADLVAYRRKQA